MNVSLGASTDHTKTGLRTDDGLVDPVSAQLYDFLRFPTERWYR